LLGFITFLVYGSVVCLFLKVWSWAWWFMPVILALERLRQENHEFESILGYIVSSRGAWTA
jgi:hypothetical protein